jgi:type III restriction enzyme
LLTVTNPRSLPYRWTGFYLNLLNPNSGYLIFETKGYRYEGTEEKKAGAERWCRAVNADGRFGTWEYRFCKSMEVIQALDEIAGAID